MWITNTKCYHNKNIESIASITQKRIGVYEQQKVSTTVVQFAYDVRFYLWQIAIVAIERKKGSFLHWEKHSNNSYANFECVYSEKKMSTKNQKTIRSNIVKKGKKRDRTKKNVSKIRIWNGFAFEKCVKTGFNTYGNDQRFQPNW